MSEEWPYNSASHAVAKSIDWSRMAPLASKARPSVWRKIAKTDADKLRSDPRFKAIFQSLDPATQEIVNALADDRPAERGAAVRTKTEPSTKSTILDRINDAILTAEETDDMAAKLRGLELYAKIEQLLSVKPVEDRNITINVLTGVER